MEESIKPKEDQTRLAPAHTSCWSLILTCTELCFTNLFKQTVNQSCQRYSIICMGRCETWESAHKRLVFPSRQCPCSVSFVCARISAQYGKNVVMHPPQSPDPVPYDFILLKLKLAMKGWKKGHIMTRGQFTHNCRLHFRKCNQVMLANASNFSTTAGLGAPSPEWTTFTGTAWNSTWNRLHP
jgi:hypothetical protein